MGRTARIRMVGGFGGLTLLAGAAAIWSLFAAPEPDLGLPPTFHPDVARAPAVVPDHPETRHRRALCDGAEQGLLRAPRPLTPPQSWFTDDDYPTLALMAGHAGRTTTDLVIDARGAVIGCGVSGSSGHWTLDRATCAIFRQRARFVPAEDARGCPVPSVWHQRVRWQIPAE